jgi:hypothetical protein
MLAGAATRIGSSIEQAPSFAQSPSASAIPGGALCAIAQALGMPQDRMDVKAKTASAGSMGQA